MASPSNSLEAIRSKLDEVKCFLSVTLSIANAHTVDFYTRNVWDQFMAVPPVEVLSAITSDSVHKRAPDDYRSGGNGETKTTFGFCDDSKRLVDVAELLEAARAHSLPGLGLCMSRNELLLSLRDPDSGSPLEEGAVVEPDEFMNSKKSHEVQAMSEVVASLAEHCRVKQVIDVGSGKGYLCSFLSLRYGLQVYGIDSSSSNTHGAQERNRKLKKYSRAYQRHTRGRARRAAAPPTGSEVLGAVAPRERDGSGFGAAERSEDEGNRDAGQRRDETEFPEGAAAWRSGEEEVTSRSGEDEAPLKPSLSSPDVPSEETAERASEADAPDPESPGDPFMGAALSVDAVEPAAPPRVPPGELSAEERERRKRENLERKARNGGAGGGSLYSPLTSYVTAETELREIIAELEDAIMVGLHTCGDLAPSTLRMFAAKRELLSVCSVGCCYHLLSEEHDPGRQECPASSGCGFPMSQYLRNQSWFCGRNARMSACLALERVTVGQGIQMESLFYRAVLHVILRDHYSAFKSEKRVGNIYSKANSFVDYVQRALRRLELDESKLSASVIQDYHDTYRPRMCEMQAFNMLKVTLAPCIEGLLLLDRLCYLKEQEDVSFSALVQLFDPVLSPRCYGVVGVKTPGIA